MNPVGSFIYPIHGLTAMNSSPSPTSSMANISSSSPSGAASLTGYLAFLASSFYFIFSSLARSVLIVTYSSSGWTSAVLFLSSIGSFLNYEFGSSIEKSVSQISKVLSLPPTDAKKRSFCVNFTFVVCDE